MNKLTIREHKPKASFNSWNPKDTLRQIDAQGADIEKMSTAINWLIDQVLSMKTPASTSVDAKTNKTKQIEQTPAKES